MPRTLWNCLGAALIAGSVPGLLADDPPKSTPPAAKSVVQQYCLGCHNQDPNSTKRDWKVGDVGGVLEIVRPLDRDIARTREGLRGTFLLVAVVSGALLLVSALVLLLRPRRVLSPAPPVRGEDA